MRRAIGYLFLLLAPAVPLAQARVNAINDLLPPPREVLYLRSPEEIRVLFPGLEDLMASVYWLRAVQYYGHERAFDPDPHYALLAPLIHMTNALDPRLEIAYRYGAVFLAEERPQGAGMPAEGVEVLENGIRAMPQSWRLRWDLGSLYFFFLRDSESAARTLMDASKIPGAPFWLKSLAASILSRSGYRSTAREIWREQYENSTEGAIRDNALFHIQQIDALNACDALSAAASRLAARTGQLPATPQDLVAAGLLRRIPTDPSGVPYAYDPDTGKFTIARASKYWRAHYDS